MHIQLYFDNILVLQTVDTKKHAHPFDIRYPTNETINYKKKQKGIPEWSARHRQKSRDENEHEY